ncbi:MAG: putative molybdenum carrier protein [Desulfobacter postgatei]|uniref:YpsA SLOG family protein n=1 Tax=Desulfobacter postgatei TaxID=2293 RepID=UPI0023F50EC2|nr:putative molybdenum carrier protein [Desulfobacter postgatei]MDD4274779.1 putative molybdenum carrier protein [Desulfobacter postgatei]
MIKKIISGGQTGADIAGVDAGISCGVPYGGWLPKGRKTENGPLSGRYTEFQAMSRGGYPKRTEQNIIDSDGTVEVDGLPGWRTWQPGRFIRTLPEKNIKFGWQKN